MSERKWTEAQREAISHRGSDLLVSASAGSGKTATLTARLIDLLCSPDSDVMPSEVLAVTFTNAASAEMRSRLFAAASAEVARDPSNSRARRLLSSVGQVQICTMHAFCLTAIRPYFSELGLASDFRIADDTEAAMLRERAIGDTVSRLFDDAASGEDLAILADTLSDPRSETSLDQTLLSVCTSLERRGADSEALLRYAERLTAWAGEDPLAAPPGEILKKKLTSFACHYERVFEHFIPLLSGVEQIEKYVPECERLAAAARTVRHAASQDYARAREMLEGITFPRLVTVKPEFQTDESLEFKAYRDKFKDAFRDMCGKFFVFTGDEVRTSLLRTAELNRALSRVAAEYEKRYSELKCESGAVDFGDLERLAHRLFTDENGGPTPAALRLAEKYRYVFIDEYQDTNRIQDDIFRAISAHAERFMVGDVKQSIYAFRGADPDVFSSLRREYMAGNGGRYIHMSENFRSASNVIRYTNAVSEMMFRYSDTPFDDTDRLICARGGADCADKCELVLLSGKIPGENDGVAPADGGVDGESPAPVAGISEARYIAGRIQELLATGQKADGSPVRPGDIAILIRSANTRAQTYAKELEALGIPVSVDAKRDFFADETVLTLLCILHAVACPELDIYFTGALKSAPFGFSLDDAVKIRLAFPQMPVCASLENYATLGEDAPLAAKCRRAVDTLTSLRCCSTVVSPDVFIKNMADALDLENTLAATPSAVRQKIRELRNLARTAEKSGFRTLSHFLSFTDRMMEKGTATEAASPGNAVSIMSVHHAKGLEFPVCFLACAAADFNLRDTHDPVLFEPSVGVAARLVDQTGLVSCETLLHRLASEMIRCRAVDEEMRVLYVAMTRARDRLIVCASVGDGKERLRAAQKSASLSSEYSVRSTTDFLGWLLAPICAGEECGAAVLTPEIPADAAVSVSASEGAKSTGEPDSQLTQRLRDTFRERFSFVYPYEHLQKIPSKLVVSRLYPEILDEEPEDRDIAEVILGEEAPLPRFLSESAVADGARIGTATHVFMQFCNFAALGGDDRTQSPPDASGGSEAQDSVLARVDAELKRLVGSHFIDKTNAGLVDREQIAAFVNSHLFRRIRTARQMWREFRFNAARSAADFTGDAELAGKLREQHTEVIVQGVVDLLFEDANGRYVLVDYKTDRLSAAQRRDTELAKKILRERHRNQLAYYRDILSDMLGRKIDETLIYSLALADTVPVD